MHRNNHPRTLTLKVSHASELNLVISIKLGYWRGEAGFEGVGVFRGIGGYCVFGLCGIREQQDRMNKPQKRPTRSAGGKHSEAYSLFKYPLMPTVTTNAPPPPPPQRLSANSANSWSLANLNGCPVDPRCQSV